ncbi:lipocalin-like domain-containing protein [Colwellia psychrerythraea]|uniref:Putative lipoprotein n=1 Tax=Colwellia psychrerythraea (strain 34H / ATCC BAA-681) TaxID=167879 RepID=Q481B3_COLP3|nr:lipocalin-like domain-containing protein [Colwellia psychrerythraea]AAZ26648.1 putative lipoprotein [Colwellia psychrerythraea 34H]
MIKQIVNKLLLTSFVFVCFVFLLAACQPVEQKSTPSALQMASGKPVTRGTELVFPKDHGIHAEQGIEWWYLTANLQSDTGETFGVQWTLFRTLMPSNIESKWWDNNLYFAHFAMQHKQQHVAFERFSRSGQAMVTSSPFKATIDNWQLSSINEDFLPLKLAAVHENYEIALTLSDSPMTLHGDNGYSQKTQSGHASYYFSYPFLKVKGSLTFAGKTYKVTGNAWYDREWSASLLDKSQLGWDWFSLVDSQSEESDQKGLMLFCIRGRELKVEKRAEQEEQSNRDNNGLSNGNSYDYCRGTRIAPDGEATDISKEGIKLSVVETVTIDNHDYPSKWQVELPNTPDIIIESITKDSRNKLTIPYWEGRVKATGGFNGNGYAEITGY